MSNEEVEEQIQNIIQNCALKNKIKRKIKIIDRLGNTVKKWCNIDPDMDIDYIVIAILFMSFSISIISMGYVTEKIENPVHKLVGVFVCLLIILIPLIFIPKWKQKHRINLDNNDEIRRLSQQMSKENIKYLKEDIHWTINVVNETVFQIILVGWVMTLFTQILKIMEDCKEFSYLNCIKLFFIIFLIFAIIFIIIINLKSIEENSFKNEIIIKEIIIDEYSKINNN